MLEKLKQIFVTWGIPSISVSATLGLILNGQWGAAILAISGAIIWKFASLGRRFVTKFLKEFNQKIEENIDRSAPKLADLAFNQASTILTRFWWKLTFNFQGKYYESLIYKYRIYRTEGLKTKTAVGLDLENVFVSLRVAPESPDRISSEMIQSERLGEKPSIWDFLAMSNEPSYQHMAIIAPPGAGKTTLLEHITLTYTKNTQRRQHHKAPKLIPILLYLRDIRDDISKQNALNLADLVKEKICQEHKELDPLDWFRENLERGQCLVMLDGLDEVADEVQRKRVSTWVDRQIASYPKSQFLVTSRPFGYHSAPLEKIQTVLEVQPFSLAEMAQFLHNWYLQTEAKWQARKIDQGVRQAADTKANDLIARINSNPAIASMALNPLLLTMIATVHDNRGALPGRRVELYDEICDVLLGRRQDAKGIPNPLTAQQNKLVLQKLALGLMLAKKRDFSLGKAGEFIKGKLSTFAGENLAPGDYLERIAKLSGLLIEKERGKYEFAHKSFQEYLAAAQIQEANQVQLLATKMDDAWWDETIRLYAADNDATELIIAAITYPSINALTLAYDCFAEGAPVLPKVRQQLEEILEAGLESDDQQIAKLAAEVKLSRRLKKLLRLDEHTEIDMSHITCAEYQLFIYAKQKERKNRQPDHWETPHFAKGMANQPVTLVRASDVKEFCEWLAIHNENKELYSFRVPSYIEIERHPINLEGIGCWCSQTNDELTVYITASQFQKWRERFARSIEHAIKNALARAIKSAIAGALKSDIADDLARYIKSDIVAQKFAQNLALALDLDFTHTLDLDLALALDLDFVLDLVFSLERYLTLDIDGQDLTLARDLAHDLAIARALAHNLARARVRARDLACDLALASALACNRELDRDRDLVRAFVRSIDLDFFLTLTATLYLAFTIYQKILDSDHQLPQSVKRSQKYYKKLRDVYGQNFEKVSPICTFLLLIEMHRNNVMPAWESIRIVRERIQTK